MRKQRGNSNNGEVPQGAATDGRVRSGEVLQQREDRTETSDSSVRTARWGCPSNRRNPQKGRLKRKEETKGRVERRSKAGKTDPEHEVLTFGTICSS